MFNYIASCYISESNCALPLNSLKKFGINLSNEVEIFLRSLFSDPNSVHEVGSFVVFPI